MSFTTNAKMFFDEFQSEEIQTAHELFLKFCADYHKAKADYLTKEGLTDTDYANDIDHHEKRIEVKVEQPDYPDTNSEEFNRMMNCAYYMSNRVIVIRLVKIKAAGLVNLDPAAVKRSFGLKDEDDWSLVFGPIENLPPSEYRNPYLCLGDQD